MLGVYRFVRQAARQVRHDNGTLFAARAFRDLVLLTTRFTAQVLALKMA